MPISIFRAGETITPGNIVAVTHNSVVKKASVNDPETFRAIGVATTSGYAGDAVKVVVDDQVHIFSGLTPGSQLYLSPTPGLYTTSYTTITSGVGLSLNGSSNLSPFARAISASGITLQTPAAVVADVSSESIVLENTPTNNIFGFLTEGYFDVVKESGDSPYIPYDPEAYAYIRAVENADGQFLENNVRQAIDNFVLGCKADGIWSAIKASCILAGARTLSGALVPLVGTAPTNPSNVFVQADYNRKTGLVGNGTTKYLDSGRLSSSDPQDNVHLSTYVTTAASAGNTFYMGSASTTEGGSELILGQTTTPVFRVRCRNGTPFDVTVTGALEGFFGASRLSSANFTVRAGSSNATATSVSQSLTTGLPLYIYGRYLNGALAAPVNARLAFYSIGESLNLALLDARVTDLINAFAAAIS